VRPLLHQPEAHPQTSDKNNRVVSDWHVHIHQQRRSTIPRNIFPPWPLQIDRHLCWRIIWGKLNLQQWWQPHISDVTNRLCSWILRMPNSIAQSTPDQDYFINNRIQIRSAFTIYARCIAANSIFIGAKIDPATTRVNTNGSLHNIWRQPRMRHLVECSKMRPRTKHIALEYHHFRSHVNKTGSIKKIDGSLQPANIFTKTLDLMLFVPRQKEIIGW